MTHETESQEKKGALRNEPRCCANCRFFQVSKNGWDQGGECRRVPPVAVAAHDEYGTTMMTGFPDVQSDSWCGAHKKKRENDRVARFPSELEYQ